MLEPVKDRRKMLGVRFACADQGAVNCGNRFMGWLTDGGSSFWSLSLKVIYLRIFTIFCKTLFSTFLHILAETISILCNCGLIILEVIMKSIAI